MKDPKTHFAGLQVSNINPCSRSWDAYNKTMNWGNVTCKTCLNIKKKHKLRDRREFPDCPTFNVSRTLEGQLWFRCPSCGKANIHGGGGGVGLGDGNRGSHCGCWECYDIREVGSENSC